MSESESGHPATPASRRTERRRDTRSPHRSRERALKILFDADVRGQQPLQALERVVADPAALAILDDLDADDLVADEPRSEPPASGDREAPAATAAPALDGFARRLVEGVHDHRESLDATIEAHARRWTVARMPVVDRNVLRLAAYELLHEDTSPAIVIDEAVELAKALSTEKSARFVNGVLEAIRRDAGHDPLETSEEPADR